MKLRIGLVLFMLGCLVWVQRLPVQGAPTASTELVSRSAAGVVGNGGSFEPSLSGDGQLVAFVSSASNLEPTAVDSTFRVFLKNRTSGTVELVAVNANGDPSNDTASNPAISSNGQHIAFTTTATNLHPADNNFIRDVYVRDTQAMTTTLISVGFDGTLANQLSSVPAISADGRFVVFESTATNLVSDDFNFQADVFVRDRDADEDGIFDEPEADAMRTVRVSVSGEGTAGNNASHSSSISADGRFVAFVSSATNLVAGDTNSQPDVFLHDRDADENGVFDETEPAARATYLISVGDDGEPADGLSLNTAVSADGRFVAFESYATNLLPTAVDIRQHIYVRDWQAGTTTLISRTSTGAPADDSSGNPVLSGDGRFIAFESVASDLTDEDPNFGGDIYLHDRDADENGIFDETGAGATTTQRINLHDDGAASVNGQAFNPSMRTDGAEIAFESDANDLVADDSNGFSDVFVRQWAGSTPPPSGADLAVTISGTAVVLGDGASATFQLSVTNNGPDTAENVSVSRTTSGNQPLFAVGCLFCLDDATLAANASKSMAYASLGTISSANQVYQGSSTLAATVSSPTADPNPSNNSDSFTTDYYTCSAANGCLLDEFLCLLYSQGSPFAPDSRADVGNSFMPRLALYYHVRDQILTPTAAGQHYTDLYYTHTAELTALVLSDETVWNSTVDGLAVWEPTLQALVNGEGDTAVLTAEHIAIMDNYLTMLSDKGSPALQQTIAEERAKLPPLESFVGQTVAEVRGDLIGYGTYLPLIEK